MEFRSVYLNASAKIGNNTPTDARITTPSPMNTSIGLPAHDIPIDPVLLEEDRKMMQARGKFFKNTRAPTPAPVVEPVAPITLERPFDGFLNTYSRGPSGSPYSTGSDTTPSSGSSSTESPWFAPRPLARAPSPSVYSTGSSSTAGPSHQLRPARSYDDVNTDARINCQFKRRNGEVCNEELLDSPSFISDHVRLHLDTLPGNISQCPFGMTVNGKACGGAHGGACESIVQSFARHVYELHFYQRGRVCPHCSVTLSRGDALRRHIQTLHVKSSKGTTTSGQHSRSSSGRKVKKGPKLAKKRT